MQGNVIESNRVAIQLTAAFESLKSISLDNEGRHVYLLRPKMNGVSHRIICEISLRDSIKYVTFKSAFSIVNETDIEMELLLLNSQNKPLLTSSIVLGVSASLSYYLTIS